MSWRIPLIVLSTPTILAILAGVSFATPLDDAQAASLRGDNATAVRILQDLAEHGNVQAQLKLGDRYLYGNGVTSNEREAAKWFHKAAEQGNADAQLILGDMYEHGQSIPRDQVVATMWYGKAAAQGNTRAQILLGIKYEYGQGVPVDHAEAGKWYRKAAELGDPYGQLLLGDYLRPIMPPAGAIGVPYPSRAGNSIEALRWYRKSANQGYVSAQVLLGDMYSNGDGVAQDKVEAYKWYVLATSNFSEFQNAYLEKTVKKRSALAAQMTSSEIEKAQKLAREWKPIGH